MKVEKRKYDSHYAVGIFQNSSLSSMFSTIWTHFKEPKSLFIKVWTRFWMFFAGLSFFGRIATHMATWFVPPYYGRIYLARANHRGYISPRATIHHTNLLLGANIFVDDGVLIYKDDGGGPVNLGDNVHLNRDTIIQTGYGGNVKIGSGTHVQPHCQFSAYKATIQIGSDVEIAPYCAFYPYHHGVSPGEPIRRQPLQTKGGIVVDDGAWLGVGVIVLERVRIGRGAVVGAGAVVTRDVPDEAIAVGVPARVVKMRSDIN